MLPIRLIRFSPALSYQQITQITYQQISQITYQQITQITQIFLLDTIEILKLRSVNHYAAFGLALHGYRLIKVLVKPGEDQVGQIRLGDEHPCAMTGTVVHL